MTARWRAGRVAIVPPPCNVGERWVTLGNLGERGGQGSDSREK